jgi:murein tripeptide amidase MpaA
VWVIARLHGGEPPAGWCAEGLLRRLAAPDDAAAARLRAAATLHVLPLANPDGARAGFLRASGAGVDPNRCWHRPGACAEVAALQAAMQAAPPDLTLDLHTDFELPFPYVDPADGAGPGLTRRIALRGRLESVLAAASADFQTARRYPYPAPPDPEAQAQQCAGWVALHHGTPALTLELPASDYDARPDAREGWSPVRSMALGAALVEAVGAALELP